MRKPGGQAAATHSPATTAQEMADLGSWEMTGDRWGGRAMDTRPEARYRCCGEGGGQDWRL